MFPSAHVFILLFSANVLLFMYSIFGYPMKCKKWNTTFAVLSVVYPLQFVASCVARPYDKLCLSIL